MNTIRAIVTATGCASVGEQILKALRLSALPFHRIACDCTPDSTGVTLADDFLVLPRAAHPHYAEQLLSACRKHYADALFIGSEAELLAVSPHRAEFERENIFVPLQPEEVLQLCLDKAKLYESLNSLGFSTPWYRRIQTPEDLSDIPAFPLVFKPSKQSGGSADVFIVRHDDELRFYSSYLLERHGEFVAQEYVGTPDSEFTVGVLQDMGGDIIGSIALHRDLSASFSRRLKTANTTERTELGPQLVISSGISQGLLGGFPQVCGPSTAIATALGGRGPMNIQCRFAEGKLCLFEINPRFSGTTSLRALGGWNEPEMLVRRHVLGEQIKPVPYAGTVRIGRRLEEVIIPEKNNKE